MRSKKVQLYKKFDEGFDATLKGHSKFKWAKAFMHNQAACSLVFVVV